jgi:hypothetical protein
LTTEAVVRSEQVLHRRRVLARVWAVATVLWSCIRTLLAWVLLGEYGLNPWVYLCVDLGSSLVLGRSTPIMVVSFIDRERQRALRWALVTGVAYVVPDIFLFTSTRRVPPVTLTVLITLMATSVTVTVVTVVRRVRSARADLVQLSP